MLENIPENGYLLSLKVERWHYFGLTMILAKLGPRCCSLFFKWEICKHIPQQTILPSKEIQANVKNTNVRKNCEICPKLTIKTLKESQWRHSGVLIVNFELTSDLFLVFSLLPLNKKIFAGRLWLFLAVFADTLQVLRSSSLIYNVPKCNTGLNNNNSEVKPIRVCGSLYYKIETSWKNCFWVFIDALPISIRAVFHIKTKHLICWASQMNGLFMKRNTRLK